MLTPFGIAIRKIRLDRGLKLHDMADRLGLTSAFVSAIETGRKPIPGAYIDSVAQTFSLSEWEVLQLRQAEDETRTTVKVESLKPADRALIANLARKVKELPSTELETIRTILAGYHGPSLILPRRRKPSENIPSIRYSKPTLERGFTGNECHRFSFRVPPLPAWQIEEQANRCRTLFLHKEQIWFPIVEVFELALPRVVVDFNLEIFSADEIAVEGLLLPQSSTIILHENVYDDACAGEGRARFTLCHEFGHFMLHRIFKATLDTQKRRGYHSYEDSEWQADRFAASLLSARAHAGGFQSISELANKCGMSHKAAAVRWAQFRSTSRDISPSVPLLKSAPQIESRGQTSEKRYGFTESRISASEMQTLVTELDVIGQTVAEASIPQPLRQLLFKHISYLSWAIRNFDTMTTDGIYAAFTPTNLKAIAAADEDKGTAQPYTQSWYQSLLTFTQKIMKGLNLIDEGAKKVNDIKNNIDDLFK
jgi:Zn-dependent peptidase ImmA (M78 family)/transcriptional regulator with XRE-family HTH domain